MAKVSISLGIAAVSITLLFQSAPNGVYVTSDVPTTTLPSTASTITSMLIPTETSWQSFGNLVSALDRLGQHDGLFLYGDSCGSPNLPGYVPGNCSATCASVAQAFGSPPAFGNCVAYCTITQALAGPAAWQEAELEAKWGIQPGDVAGASRVSANIMNCLYGYLRSLPECQGTNYSDDCPLVHCQEVLKTSDAGSSSNNRSILDDKSLRVCVGSVCQYVRDHAAIDPDIGGVGVRFVRLRSDDTLC